MILSRKRLEETNGLRRCAPGRIRCGAYASVEETLVLTPKAEETVFPRGDVPYEAAYAR